MSARHSSLIKNTSNINPRGVDITDYDSLIPFGTAESATKIARDHVDSSD